MHGGSRSDAQVARVAAGESLDLTDRTSLAAALDQARAAVCADVSWPVAIQALEEQKGLAVAIQSSVAGSAAETAYLADFNALGTEITAALAGASFDGVNIYAAGSATNNLVVQTGTTTTYSVHGVAGAATTVATATGSIVRAGATAAAVDTANATFAAKLGTLGGNAKSLERQLTFTSKIQDALEAGVGNLVDADLAKESARLTALQTKQQLGVQALGIANQSGSILLGLFR